MSTYVYEYRRGYKGECIAKYSNDILYDLTKSRFESSADIIGKVQGGYLYKYVDYSSLCTGYYVEDNVLYLEKTIGKETVLIAKNNIIYSYSGYRENKELAEYEGNCKEALFAYMALCIIGKASLTQNNNRNTYSAKGSSVSSSSSGNSSRNYSSSGDGCGAIIAFIALFLFSSIIVGIMSLYEYYTLLHIIIPAIIIVGVFLKRQIKDEEYEYPLSTIVGGGIIGAGIGLLTLFIVSIIDMGVNRYLKMGRTLLISIDDAYTGCFILIIILVIMLNAKKKEKK